MGRRIERGRWLLVGAGILGLLAAACDKKHKEDSRKDFPWHVEVSTDGSTLTTDVGGQGTGFPTGGAVATTNNTGSSSGQPYGGFVHITQSCNSDTTEVVISVLENNHFYSKTVRRSELK